MKNNKNALKNISVTKTQGRDYSSMFAGGYVVPFIVLSILASCNSIDRSPHPLADPPILKPSTNKETLEKLPNTLAKNTITLADNQLREISHWWKNLYDEDLDALIDMIAQQNFDVRAALLSKKKAEFERNRAGASLKFDNVEASASNPVPNIPPESKSLYNLPEQLSFENSFWNKISRYVEEAEQDIRLTDTEISTARISLISELAGHYISLRAAQAIHVLRRQQISHQQELLETLYKNNKGKPKDEEKLEAAENELDSLKEALEQDEAIIHTLQYSLSMLLGRPYASLPIKPFNPNKHSLKHTLRLPDTIVSTTLYNRPDTQKTLAEIEQSYKDSVAMRAELIPVFPLSTSEGTSSSALRSFFNSDFFTLSGNAGKSLVIQTNNKNPIQAQQELSEVNHKKAMMTAMLEVEELLSKNTALVQYYREKLASHEQAMATLKVMNEKTGKKKSKQAEELRQRTQLMEKRISLFNSLNALINNRISLIKALGGSYEPQGIQQTTPAKRRSPLLNVPSLDSRPLKPHI